MDDVSDTGELATAVLLGTTLAAGILLVGTRLPRWSAPSLVRRIAPYLRDVADPLGLTPLSPPVAHGIASRHGWWGRAMSAGSAPGGLELRLRRAGWDLSAPRFRARQLAGGVAGLVAGGALVVVLAVVGRFWWGSAVLPLLCAAAGGAALPWLLRIAETRRGRLIREEVPTVLEFLALCLSAGESLPESLRRVSAVGAGELNRHLRAVLLATGTGSPLADALTDMARSVDVAPVSRAVDHLVAAIERGAPLAQVLQAQAIDARDDAKRVLIEQAGRKEILMLLPLVFLVLPLSVIFAIFPGIVMLRLGV